ncbi:hypothetical protein NLJ89_g10267 [Agrocybe chaxingu]|uniref:Uncharacterized protein n=1 Tax=Agrocybe chaxingu TaxID=84603 RepID=A0A9W8JZ12_9AGAR|nr:hypothetical protein NLJ89_g10267 [Agrocybe chaxingu]
MGRALGLAGVGVVGGSGAAVVVGATVLVVVVDVGKVEVAVLEVEEEEEKEDDDDEENLGSDHALSDLLTGSSLPTRTRSLDEALGVKLKEASRGSDRAVFSTSTSASSSPSPFPMVTAAFLPSCFSSLSRLLDNDSWRTTFSPTSSLPPSCPSRFSESESESESRSISISFTTMKFRFFTFAGFGLGAATGAGLLSMSGEGGDEGH